MAANVQNAPGRTDWAEDSEPDLANAIPPPQITKNKDGTETIVTVFINEDGKRVKRTQRVRRTVVKKKENPRVAERRLWPKMGVEAGRPAGPQSDTTTIGENIIFRPVIGFKSGQQQEKAPEEDKKADALKKMQIKCRICSGDHFTTKCPFKDTMAPEGEAAAPADMDDAASTSAGALGTGGGGYVPPHLRKGGAAASGGERMGGKFERDDLATLRVTNVSNPFSVVDRDHANFDFRFPSLPKNQIFAKCSSASAVSHVCSWPRIARPAGQRASLSFHMPIDQTPLVRVKGWMAMVLVI